MPENHDIKDIELADEGLARILWADRASSASVRLKACASARACT